MYSVLDFTSSQTNDLHRLCKDQYLSKIRRNEDTYFNYIFHEKKNFCYTKKKKKTPMYIFNLFISSIFHQFHPSDTAGYCRHNVFRCQIYKRNEIYKNVYYIFHEKKPTSTKQTNKVQKKTHQIYIFILLFQYFINFIPPTLLATVQTKCSGKQ